MKTILLAAAAALGVALAAPAYAEITHHHAVGGNYRLAATDSEGSGGSNPYAAPITNRPKSDPAVTPSIA